MVGYCSGCTEKENHTCTSVGHNTCRTIILQKHTQVVRSSHVIRSYNSIHRTNKNVLKTCSFLLLLLLWPSVDAGIQALHEDVAGGILSSLGVPLAPHHSARLALQRGISPGTRGFGEEKKNKAAEAASYASFCSIRSRFGGLDEHITPYILFAPLHALMLM